MILFITESLRRGVIDCAGRPRLLTASQFDALYVVSGSLVRTADDVYVYVDELFRAHGVCIPEAVPGA